MQVMSSMTSSSVFHQKKLSLISTFAAVSGVPYQSSNATNLATSSFVKNSHTPSDAITINESVGLIWNSKISGRALTPTLCAILSPSDQDIASPGMSYFSDHTQ